MGTRKTARPGRIRFFCWRSTHHMCLNRTFQRLRISGLTVRPIFFWASACFAVGDVLSSTSSFYRRLWILYVLFGFPAIWSGFGYWVRHLDTISRLQFPRERFGDKLTPRMKLVDIKFDYPPSRICFFYKNNIRLLSRNPLPRLLAPSRCHPHVSPRRAAPHESGGHPTGKSPPLALPNSGFDDDQTSEPHRAGSTSARRDAR